MKIGIIGAGNIGSTLGRKWVVAGHQIYFGVRNPQDEKYQPLRTAGLITPINEAVDSAEVVVLALPGNAVADFASQYGAALAGKLVIDTTNNVRGSEMHSLSILADKAPGARLGRAFSTLGWENFADPEINGVQIDLFFCSDPGVRATMEGLITAVGLRPVYIGDIDAAPALDGMTRVWFALVFNQGYGRRIAFKLLEG